MRMWGSENRGPQNQEYKDSLLSSLRKINLDIDKFDTSVDSRLTNELATKLENSLSDLKDKYPDIHDKFLITDAFRDESVTYGALNSMHKYGGAFDFNYSSFNEDELETIYEVFGDNGLCCPLDTWQGQDEGMHIELASDVYEGNVGDSLVSSGVEEQESIYELLYITSLGDTNFDITEVYRPDWGKVGVLRNGLLQHVDIDYTIVDGEKEGEYSIEFNEPLEQDEVVKIV